MGIIVVGIILVVDTIAVVQEQQGQRGQQELLGQQDQQELQGQQELMEVYVLHVIMYVTGALSIFLRDVVFQIFVIQQEIGQQVLVL